MTLALLPNPLLPDFPVCGRRKGIRFALVYKLPQFLWLNQHTHTISVSVAQKSGHGFTGSSALARAAVSSQGLTRERVALKLSWSLAGYISFQFVGLRASVSNRLLASDTISSFHVASPARLLALSKPARQSLLARL